MQHPDSDDLALFAVAPDGDGRLVEHVAGCPRCTAEVDGLRQVVDLGPLSNFGEDAPRPGAHVWDAITAELGFGGTERLGRVDPEADSERTSGAAAGSAPTVLPSAREPMSGLPSARRPEAVEALRRLPTKPPGPRRRPHPAPMVPTDAPGPAASTSARVPRWVIPVAALLVGAALGAGALVLSQRQAQDPVAAVAALTVVTGGPLADPGAPLGQAELVAAGQQRRIVVRAVDLPPITGAYEVWLFGNDGRMVALGALNQGSGDFTVPQGIDTVEYRTIDVSDEPSDGDPAHSGISVVRGTFS